MGQQSTAPEDISPRLSKVLEEFPDFQVAAANCEFKSIMDVDVDIADVVGNELVAQAIRDESDKFLETVQMGAFLGKISVYREAAYNASVRDEPRPSATKFMTPSTLVRPPVTRPSKAAVPFLATGKVFVRSRPLSVGVARSSEVVAFTKTGGQVENDKKILDQARRIWALFLEVGEASSDWATFADATSEDQALIAELKQEDWSLLPEESLKQRLGAVERFRAFTLDKGVDWFKASIIDLALYLRECRKRGPSVPTSEYYALQWVFAELKLPMKFKDNLLKRHGQKPRDHAAKSAEEPSPAEILAIELALGNKDPYVKQVAAGAMTMALTSLRFAHIQRSRLTKENEWMAEGTATFGQATHGWP